MSDGLQGLNKLTDVVFSYKRDSKTAEKKTDTLATADFTFYEFFAGGGMARAGLGLQWQCLFANDFDAKKAATYNDNWGAGVMLSKDVGKVEVKDIPGTADLIWASFPCQDLSLAGMGAGLKGGRSGTFWPFWSLVTKLIEKKRGPKMIVLENVCGTLTSHGGKDFTAIAEALADAGFKYGAIVIDAVEFVPQSRPRLFIVAVAKGVDVPAGMLSPEATMFWHPKALQVAKLQLKGKAKDQWLWWKLPAPARRTARFADLVEENPTGVSWHTQLETKKLIGMMSSINREKLDAAKKSGQLLVGTIYRRTRLDDDSEKVQRAEIRFDDVAGCLRTSSGGSSRQIIMIVKGDEIKSRLLSAREAARLMGLPETYRLPKAYNEAYHLAGDGLVVPVVRYLAQHILEPVLMVANAKKPKVKAASRSL